MRRSLFLVLLLSAAPLSGVAARTTPKDLAAPACAGTLSGEVSARFECSAFLAAQPDGQLFFTITIPKEVAGIPSIVPGTFLLPGKPAARTYTLDDLGFGKASVAVEGGRLFTATKTSSQRGEVTLAVASFQKSKKRPGTWDIHGTYRARLVRVGGGIQDSVVVEVSF